MNENLLEEMTKNIYLAYKDLEKTNIYKLDTMYSLVKEISYPTVDYMQKNVFLFNINISKKLLVKV